jgi:hypothetical protein
MNLFDGLNTTALAERHTIHEMTVVFREAKDKVIAAHKQLQEAQSQLCSVFGGSCYSFDVNPDNMRLRTEDQKIDVIERGLKRSAWKIIAERLQIRNYMATEAVKKLDDQLEKVDQMPEIETESIMAFLAGTVGRIGEFQTEAVRECFEMIRPRRIMHKTNERNAKYEVGKKIILSGWVRANWGGGYAPSYYREQDFRILQNAFSLMDGKGAIKSHYGELADDIVKTTRPDKDDALTPQKLTGETEYFRWKVYRNGNLHLEFRRMDLVQRLNEIGGAGTLRQ